MFSRSTILSLFLLAGVSTAFNAPYTPSVTRTTRAIRENREICQTTPWWEIQGEVTIDKVIYEHLPDGCIPGSTDNTIILRSGPPPASHPTAGSATRYYAPAAGQEPVVPMKTPVPAAKQVQRA